MKRGVVSGLVALALSGCGQKAEAPKTFTPTDKTEGVFVFNTGEAPQAGFTYLGDALSKRGFKVVLASGRAWRATAAKAMSTESCTLVGGFSTAVPNVAAFAKANYDRGAVGAVMIGGVVRADQNFLHDVFYMGNIYGDADPLTTQAEVDKARLRSSGYSSSMMIHGANRSGFVDGGAALAGDGKATMKPEDQRTQVIDLVEHQLRTLCYKRIERQEKAEKFRRYQEQQKLRQSQAASGVEHP